jgi:hypothetical protein
MRIAKAFGALIIVAILLTSPTNTVLTDIDELIKNDWVGTTESGTASASTGTQSSTNPPPSNPLSASSIAADALKSLEELFPGGTSGINALKSLFHL